MKKICKAKAPWGGGFFSLSLSLFYGGVNMRRTGSTRLTKCIYGQNGEQVMDVLAQQKNHVWTTSALRV